jgi:hypothetical protein
MYKMQKHSQGNPVPLIPVDYLRDPVTMDGNLTLLANSERITERIINKYAKIRPANYA